MTQLAVNKTYRVDFNVFHKGMKEGSLPFGFDKTIEAENEEDAKNKIQSAFEKNGRVEVVSIQEIDVAEQNRQNSLKTIGSHLEWTEEERANWDAELTKSTEMAMEMAIQEDKEQAEREAKEMADNKAWIEQHKESIEKLFSHWALNISLDIGFEVINSPKMMTLFIGGIIKNNQDRGFTQDIIILAKNSFPSIYSDCLEYAIFGFVVSNKEIFNPKIDTKDNPADDSINKAILPIAIGIDETTPVSDDLIQAIREESRESSGYVTFIYDIGEKLDEAENVIFKEIMENRLDEEDHLYSRSEAASQLATMLYDWSSSGYDSTKDFLEKIRQQLPKVYMPMLNEFFSGNHDT